jgi:hypothetical protein
MSWKGAFAVKQEIRCRSKGRYLIAAILVALSIGVPRAFAAVEEIAGVWDLTTNGIGWQAFGTLSIVKKTDGTLTGKCGSLDLSNIKSRHFRTMCIQISPICVATSILSHAGHHCCA